MQLTSESELSLWGNSLGLRIPKKMSDALDLEKGSKITIKLSNHKLIIESANSPALKGLRALSKNTSLKKLTKKITKKNLHNSEDFSTKAIGKEVW